jgi:hypothetical protein
MKNKKHFMNDILIRIATRKPFKNLVLMVISALLLGCVSIACSGQHKDTIGSVTLNETAIELTEGEAFTLAPTITTSNNDFSVAWTSDNENAAIVSSTGKVHAIAKGKAVVTIVVKNKTQEVSSSCTVTVKPAQKVNPGKSDGKRLNLGYATFEGDIVKGKPHGNGTMVFTQPYVIPGTINCTAAPGESVSGVFRDGKINMGTWHRLDGSQMMVKVGQRSAE